MRSTMDTTPPPAPDSVLLAFDRMARARSRRPELSRYAYPIAIALLAALLAGLAYLIVNEDRELQRDALNRDVDTLVQSISLRLETMSEAATKISLNLPGSDYNERRFTSAARELMLQKQELMHMAFVDADRRVRWSVASPGPLGDAARPPDSEVSGDALRAAIEHARRSHSAFFSPPYEDVSGPAGADNGSPFADLVVPVFSDDTYLGAILARISLPQLLREAVNLELAQNYRISLIDDAGKILGTSTLSEAPPDALHYAVPIPLLPDGVAVEASAFKQRSPLLGNALAWLVGALSLAVLARRDVRQAQVERVLRAETAFRRAMENSLATGMEVIDRDGVIRHVNPAFCQMTGWSEQELVGHGAPFPYWPAGHYAEH